MSHTCCERLLAKETMLCLSAFFVLYIKKSTCHYTLSFTSRRTLSDPHISSRYLNFKPLFLLPSCRKVNYVISASVVFMSWKECQQKACSFIDNAFDAMFVSVICCLATMHSMLTKMITTENSIANCITIEWYMISQNKLRRNLTMVISIFFLVFRYVAMGFKMLYFQYNLAQFRYILGYKI